jgi:hypothetical protein
VLAEMAGLFWQEPPQERVYGAVSLEGLSMEAPRGHPTSSDRPEGRLGEYLFDVPVAAHGELKAMLRAPVRYCPRCARRRRWKFKAVSSGTYHV